MRKLDRKAIATQRAGFATPPAQVQPTSSAKRATSKTSGSRGFYSNSRRWHQESAAFKRERPICEWHGCNKPSAFTDHIQPIKDPYNLANPLIWDRTNWQALCDYHHRLKSRTEQGDRGVNSKVKRARGPKVRIDPKTGLPLPGEPHWWAEPEKNPKC
jgi:hypothetical protein